MALANPLPRVIYMCLYTASRARAACWFAVIGVIVLLVGLFVLRWRADPSPGFVFLYIRETNNSLLSQVPAGPVQGAFPEWSAAERSLLIPPGLGGPPPRTALVVLHEIEAYDVLVQSRLTYVAKPPTRIETGKPVEWQSQASDPAGLLADRLPLDNAGRFVPQVLSVVAVAARGALTLVIEDQELVLKPGESWALARGLVNNKVESVTAGARWDAFVDQQLNADQPLTVLTVYNYGWWPRSAVTGGR